MRKIVAYVWFSLKTLFCGVGGFSIFVISTDAGKNALLSAVAYGAKRYYSTDLIFSRLHNNQIAHIEITDSHGSKYVVSNLKFSCFPKLSFTADEILISSKSENTDYKDLVDKLKIALPVLQKYLKSVYVKNLNGIKNLEYVSLGNISKCSADVDDKHIELSIDLQKCDISVVDKTQKITARLDGLFDKKTDFKIKSDNDLIDAHGVLFENFSKAKIEGQAKGIRFFSDLDIYSDKVFTSATLLDAIPKNDYLPSSTILNIKGTYVFKNNTFNADITAVDKEKTVLNGRIKTGNELFVEVEWNGIKGAAFFRINDKHITVNHLNLEHDSFSIANVSPLHVDLNAKDQILDHLQSGKLLFIFDSSKEIPYLTQLKDIRCNGIGTISKNGSKIEFYIPSASYKSANFQGISAEYSPDNLRLSADKIFFKNHKISDFKFAKYGTNIQITGDIEDKKNTLFVKGNEHVIEELKIEANGINLQSNKIDLKYSDGDLSLSSDKINIFDGSLALDFVLNKQEKSLKLKLYDIPLQNIFFSIDKKDRKLIKNMFLNGTIDLHTKDELCLGAIDLDVNNANKVALFSSNIKLQEEGINFNGKYVDGNDFVEAAVMLPMHLYADKMEVIKKEQKKAAGAIKASMDLKRFLLFSTSDRLNLKGQLEANLTLSEVNNLPVVGGTCKVSDGIVETPSVSIRNIFINTSIRNNKISIDKAIASHKKGRMTITGGGQFVFANLIPQIQCDMNVAFDKFDMLSSDTLQGELSGTIKASGPIQKLTLKGPVSLLNGIYDTTYASSEYHSDIKLTGDYKPREKQTDSSKSSSSKVPFIFDIDATCKGFRVTGKSVDATLNGLLHILTYNDTLALDGELKLDTGYINMVGVRIKLRDGLIKFVKDQGLMPLVTLHGTSIVKDMQIFLNIDNTKDKRLSIDIQSNPSYSIENIFSKIVFNKPLVGLKLSESARIRKAVQGLQHQQTSRSAFSYLDALKELLMFDSFSISNEEQIEGKMTSTVTAGKYISDNIYVGLEKATEKETKYKVAINLSPQVKVEANSSGEAGITWMYRY